MCWCSPLQHADIPAALPPAVVVVVVMEIAIAAVRRQPQPALLIGLRFSQA
jgi:hypothetical protein